MALTATRVSPGIYTINGTKVYAATSAQAIAKYTAQTATKPPTAAQPAPPVTIPNTPTTTTPAVENPITPTVQGQPDAYTPPTLKSSTIAPYKAPELNPYQIKADDSSGMFKDVFSQATGGTINSFNTAANRLRERVDSATQGDVNSAQQSALSRGFGNSGINQANISRAKASGTDAYAQGLVSLEDTFEKNRLTGLGVANNSAQGVSDASKWQNALSQLDSSQIRDLTNDNSQFGYKSDMENLQFQDDLLTNLLNSREGRTSSEAIATAGNTNALDIAELNNKNQNWRASLDGALSGSGGSLSSGSSSSSSSSGGTGDSSFTPSTANSASPDAQWEQQRATGQIELAKKYGISAGTPPPYDPSPTSAWSKWISNLDNRIMAYESKRNKKITGR